MAILVQQLANVINIIETTAGAGFTIKASLSTDCVAVPQKPDPTNTYIQIFDSKGNPTQTLHLDGTLEFQDIAGAPTLWAGTRDAFLDKLNNTYFVNSVTTTSGSIQPLSVTVGNPVVIAGNVAVTALAENLNRKHATIYVEGKPLWIRPMPAAIDNADRKGWIKLQPGIGYDISPSPGNGLYQGEISVINAIDGDTPTFYVTESI